MTFRWRHLLKLAGRLAATTPVGESERRSAVNRAYYAAFGEARAYAEAHGHSNQPRRPSHEQVWQFLRSGGGAGPNHRRAACKAIGDHGVELRTLRTQSDYFLSSPPVEEDVNRALLLSDLIIKKLAGLP